MTDLPQSLPNNPCEASAFARLVQRKQALRVERAAARGRWNTWYQALDTQQKARVDVALATRHGARLRDAALLDVIAAVIPFDPAVYRQLAGEPADRHPAVCRGCGCSGNDPCIAEHDGAEHVCRTAIRGLCTHCVERGAASAKAAA